MYANNMQFLKQPQIFGLVLALLTAGVSSLYARTTSPDPEEPRKTFWKTLVVGIIASFVLNWIAYGRDEPLASEPFNAEF